MTNPSKKNQVNHEIELINKFLKNIEKRKILSKVSLVAMM